MIDPSGTAPRRRWRWSLTVFPTQRAAAAVLALSLLWLIPRVGAILAIVGIVIVAGCMIVDYLRLPKRGDLSIQRDTPETLGLGDTVPIEYRIESSWPWSINVQLFDRLPAGLAGAVSAMPFSIDPRAAVSIVVQTTGSSR